MPQSLALQHRKPTAFGKMSIQMCPITPLRLDRTLRASPTLTARQIRDFLLGKTDGAEPLHALYDHVLDEPVPERLRALFRR